MAFASALSTGRPSTSRTTYGVPRAMVAQNLRARCAATTQSALLWWAPRSTIWTQ